MARIKPLSVTVPFMLIVVLLAMMNMPHIKVLPVMFNVAALVLIRNTLGDAQELLVEYELVLPPINTTPGALELTEAHWFQNVCHWLHVLPPAPMFSFFVAEPERLIVLCPIKSQFPEVLGSELVLHPDPLQPYGGVS